MKVNRQLSSVRRLATGLALGIAALLAATATAQIRGGFKGSGSKYPEYFPITPGTGTQTNRLRGLFFGQDWQHLSNKVFRVNGMRIEHYEITGGTNLVAVAPECLFDAEARVAWSTGRLDIAVHDGAIKLNGRRGFFARMTDSTLSLSNDVRATIRRDLTGSIAP